jgi:hypothetical protein
MMITVQYQQQGDQHVNSASESRVSGEVRCHICTQEKKETTQLQHSVDLKARSLKRNFMLKLNGEFRLTGWCADKRTWQIIQCAGLADCRACS